VVPQQQSARSPARFDHGAVIGSCATCHDGQTATGKPATHFVTNLGCDDCHVTTRWTTVNFSHGSGAYPGDHRSSVGCLDCHTSNAQQVPWPFGSFRPDRAGCHAGDFESGPHKKYEKPVEAKYTVSELRDCSGSCHYYTDDTMTTVKERRSSEHRTSGGGF